MPLQVKVQTVTPRMLAAAHCQVPAGEVGSAWKPALDKVWDFLRSHPGTWTGGHNVFMYRTDKPDGPVECDFGVEVAGAFDPEGDVRVAETPGGETAVAVHRGAYSRLDEAYAAIEEWLEANHRESTGWTWEVYSDPTPDPADTETAVFCLLTPLRGPLSTRP